MSIGFYLPTFFILCLDNNFGEKRKERNRKGGEGKEGKRNGRK